MPRSRHRAAAGATDRSSIEAGTFRQTGIPTISYAHFEFHLHILTSIVNLINGFPGVPTSLSPVICRFVQYGHMPCH